MNKFDLIDEIALKMPTKEEAAKFVEEVLKIIRETLAKSEEIRFSGIGTFRTVIRAPKIGRNVKKNIAVKIPASKTIKFKPSKQLLKILNSKWGKR